MRVHIDICHPAHVHFYRDVIAALHGAQNEVLVSSRDKDVTLSLLRAYGIEHVMLSRVGSSRIGRYREYVLRFLRLSSLMRRWKPDVLTAIGGLFVAPAGRVARVPTLVFTDTEHVALDRWMTYPLASRICTPSVFNKDLGGAHRRYDGFHELAYLHPDRFRPDPAVREELGVKAQERFIIARLVSWGASHDEGQSGFRRDRLEGMIRELERQARVFISAEDALPSGLASLSLKLAPHRIHHALAEACLYIGEGATMATEAGLLGTPSIYISSLVGTMGNFDRLQQAGIVESFNDPLSALRRAERLVDRRSKSQWQQRAREFCAQHINMTEYILSQLREVAGSKTRSDRDSMLIRP